MDSKQAPVKASQCQWYNYNVFKQKMLIVNSLNQPIISTKKVDYNSK